MLPECTTSTVGVALNFVGDLNNITTAVSSFVFKHITAFTVGAAVCRRSSFTATSPTTEARREVLWACGRKRR